jgi:hypothetical protein
VLSSASANTPRFDYDPVTLAARGLLIEEQRTNLLTYSEQFDNVAGWTKSAVTVSANAVVSPDGTQDAEKVIEDNTTAGHYVVCNPSFTSGTTYSASVFAKASERSALQILLTSSAFGANVVGAFNLSTVAASFSGGTGTAVSITSVGNGWYRCILTVQATATATANLQIRLSNTYSAASPSSYAGDGTSGLYLWGAQLEAGAFATSYIPTTTAQVTRIADSASMTGTNFSSWYNATEGTLYAETATLALSATRAIFEGADASTFKDFSLTLDNTNARANFTNRTVAGNYDVFSPNSSISANTFYKLAGSYSATSADLAYNGSLAVSKAAVAQRISADRAWIGSRTGNAIFLNGWIRRIAYYPRRLSNAELQAITS